MLRPVVSKSYLKGAIAIGVFSIFLQINSSNFFGYLQFLGIWFFLVTLYALYKRSSEFLVKDEGIVILRAFKEPETVRYTSIVDVSVSQGMLAKRLNCGSVILVLKEGKGNVKFMSGGVAVILKDVKDPHHLSDEISARLSPYGF